MESSSFVSRKKVLETLKICKTTLYTLVEEGKIEIIKVTSKKWLYNLQKYLEDNNIIIQNIDKIKICYCRVSTKKQESDLLHQIQLMENEFPGYTVIKDVGSGLNFNRKGLMKIFNLALKGKIEELVVAYRDRLCRFGFELFQFLIEKGGGIIRVLHSSEEKTPMEEICEDILSIMNVYTAKINGLRKYKNKIQSDFINSNFEHR